MAFTTPIHHETHKQSVNICGHLLYQIVLKFDKKIQKTQENFIYTHMTVTEPIFKKLLIPQNFCQEILNQTPIKPNKRFSRVFIVTIW